MRFSFREASGWLPETFRDIYNDLLRLRNYQEFGCTHLAKQNAEVDSVELPDIFRELPWLHLKTYSPIPQQMVKLP